LEARIATLERAPLQASDEHEKRLEAALQDAASHRTQMQELQSELGTLRDRLQLYESQGRLSVASPSTSTPRLNSSSKWHGSPSTGHLSPAVTKKLTTAEEKLQEAIARAKATVARRFWPKCWLDNGGVQD